MSAQIYFPRSPDKDDAYSNNNFNRTTIISQNDRTSETRCSIDSETITATLAQNSPSNGRVYTTKIETNVVTFKSTATILTVNDETTKRFDNKDDDPSKKPFTVKFREPRIGTGELSMLNRVTRINGNDDRSNDLWAKKKLIDGPDDRFDLRETCEIDDNDDAWQSVGSDESDDDSETEEDFTIEKLNESNIWPALTALGTTLDGNDAIYVRDNRRMFDKLQEHFDYSPRSFTETLVTIIEESFVRPEQSSRKFRDFATRAKSTTKFLENESEPIIVNSSSSDDEIVVLSCSTRTNSRVNDNSIDDSMRYKNFETPENTKKNLRENEITIGNEKTREWICDDRSSDFVGKNRCAGEKSFPKTPGLIAGRGIRGTSKIGRLGFGSSINDAINPGIREKPVTPRIVVNPGSPTSCREMSEARPKITDDDEYLTAESDLEELEGSNVPGEPVASSTERLDMSGVAFHHGQWLQAFEKLSNYKAVSHEITSKAGARNRKLLNYGNKLEKNWQRELERKRQKCFDVVEQLMQSNSVDPSTTEESTCGAGSPYNTRIDFMKTLRACSEYSACGNSAKGTCKQTIGPSIVCSPVNTTRKKSPRSNSSISRGTKRSPRRSFSKKTVMSVSPRACNVTPCSKIISKTFKRRSSKFKTPVIDKSSIRSVAELKSLFSPRLRAAADQDTKSRPKLPVSKFIVPSATSGPRLTPGSARSKVSKRNPDKFSHVVSPVGRYIKGDN